MISSQYDNIPKILARQMAGGAINIEEQEVLNEWLKIQANLEVWEQLNKEDIRAEMLQSMHEIDVHRVKEQIRVLNTPVFDNKGSGTRVVHRVHFLKTAWFKYAAAIIIIAGIGAYLWSTNKSTIPVKPAIAHADIPAGGNKAILVLGDESVINLDSAADGRLLSQGGAEVIKTADGEILYNTSGNSSTVSYQKLITPKGGQYQVTLSDGSQVWLNAESSIRFPSVFSEKNREVEVTGEVYFEVSQNKEKPFIVHVANVRRNLSPAGGSRTSRDLSPAGGSGGAIRDRELNKNRRDDEGGLDITVLGTSFNVNAYPNEPYNKTSLLEGSIKISNKILKPGQAYQDGVVIKTDIAQDIAWKKGIFNFHGKNVEEVMRQLSRWYDIDVSYASKPPAIIFYGEMGRNLTLSKVLEFLEKSGVKFRLEGNKLKVLN